MIPNLDLAELIRAMDQFDAKFRNTPEWKDWQDNAAHKYAIEHNGERYPVKKIVSLATGVPVSEFSGGNGAGRANRYVQAHGLRVVQIRGGNPPWTRDELILALDLYLQYRGSPPSKRSQSIFELSEALNRLGKRLRPDAPNDYRNPNGVYMKLMNFRRFDPAFPNAKGLQHGGRKEAAIWEEFALDPNKCRQVALAIRSRLDS